MFTRVLVANRGEIAVRIMRTLTELGVESVAVYSEADAHAAHVRLATHTVCLGPAPVNQSYLNQDAIISAIKELKVDAVHPGYGLLSENAEFAEKVEAAGAVFIGPTPDQLRDFGLKHVARDLAQRNGVPLLPGTALLDCVDAAVSAAAEIGYPVMIKGTAGGGGIGMQRCADEASLRAAYTTVQGLAQNNFGNSGVFVERCVDSARHIEVQIFGDGQGRVLTLGERDCSVQRRQQKVIEEAPAPELSDATREILHTAARKLGEAVKYRSAGTVEFIYDVAREQCYFLEVNTRLQVEHTVTEMIFGVDLVGWMVRLAAGEVDFLDTPLTPKGHAIQARVYAEDPLRDFVPCTGEISHWDIDDSIRQDGWVSAGTEVSPYYDPLLSKLIVHEADRPTALTKLSTVLNQAIIGGVQTNCSYMAALLDHADMHNGGVTTAFTAQTAVSLPYVEVMAPGIQTTVQDFPGRIGMWDIGVPPSGAMDSLSFRLGNQALGNPLAAAGLECIIRGPKLRFYRDATVCVTGAQVPVSLNGEAQSLWEPIVVKTGDELNVGAIAGPGARSYILFGGGLETPPYLGSRATFTLGKFGGLAGRPLLNGDMLPLGGACTRRDDQTQVVPTLCRPTMTNAWELQVMPGPHNTDEFFTAEDVAEIESAQWRVHFNSDRTGIRLIGPRPAWAREDGGEAGLHPSNIHDNAYMIGAMDYTGDQPIILGPDGPSLGGFVCPFTVIEADLWKLGQLRSDDTIALRVVDAAASAEAAIQQQAQCKFELQQVSSLLNITQARDPVLLRIDDAQPGLVVRQSGDRALLVEFGELKLDLALRIHAHFFMLGLQALNLAGLGTLTPGIRSIQLQFDPFILKRQDLVTAVADLHHRVCEQRPSTFSSRIVNLPLSWDDPATRLAIEKYVTSVRPDAPWCCPNNIEFIRRVNGLESVKDVKRIVYDASYLVMGLGDVYLGAPVAVPLDPRHRLVTTKYNPARTWTAENSVGIGGAYLCIYGMEGPGGYQFVGRTLPVWNRYVQTHEFQTPGLLRFFDQIRWFEVGAEDLLEHRRAFIHGDYHIDIEETTFDVNQYGKFVDSIADDAAAFKRTQTAAFEAEKQQWRETGQFTFDADDTGAGTTDDELVIPEGCSAVMSPVSGAVWKHVAESGASVAAGDPIMILEAMKMEMPIYADVDGTLESVLSNPGDTVNAGAAVAIIKEA